MTGIIVYRKDISEYEGDLQYYGTINGTEILNENSQTDGYREGSNSSNLGSIKGVKPDSYDVELAKFSRENSNNSNGNGQDSRNTEGNEIKSSLKDDYVIDNNFAVMTRERILREIEDSSAGTNKAYARRYITTISPTDYRNRKNMYLLLCYFLHHLKSQMSI